MLNRFFFGKKKLLLAFEYGLVLAKTAQEMGVELTPELSQKMEAIILGEFHKSPTRLAVDMIPNIIAAFELDLNK